MVGNFALKLVEATDTIKDIHLICTLAFWIMKNSFFCKNISESAMAQEMFKEFIARNNLDWEKCIDVCTDDAQSVTE